MSRRARLRATALLLLLALAPLSAQEPSEPAAVPRFERTRLPAAGRQATILTVPRFGRYAILVESSQGTGLQLVDRMAGPGEIVGEAGGKDGRLDVFLDRGEYRIVTHGHELASGEAALAVHAFHERQPQPLQLVETKLVSTSLDDFQQVSYWLHVRERRAVWFEAAGRYLRDLRLWQNGQWLVDAEPVRRVIEPRSGQPLLLCQLAAELNPGLYRLTAYGGEPQPWADDDHAPGGGERPLHLVFGFPRAGVAGRQRRTVSPFGFDRLLVAGGANYVRLELPEARPASLEVRTFDRSRPFAPGGASSAIGKQSLPPVTELRPAKVEGSHLVTVTAEAGQPYVLQHFEASRVLRFGGSGEYWISTVHSGHPADSVDATALLVDDNAPGYAREPLRHQVIELASGASWTRRANLLDTLTLYLRIEDTGSYEIFGEGGAEARFRVEPFLLYQPPKYQSPPFRGPRSVWELDAGFHVLTVRPEKKGILELTIRSSGWLDRARRAVGIEDQGERPVRASVRFPEVRLEPDHGYRLFLNHQPEVQAGAMVRRLPLDLTDPLPLTQLPGETVEVPFEARRGGGLLRAVAEDGSRLPLSLDGGAWAPEARVEAGTHTVRVRSPEDAAGTVVDALELVPAELLAETPLPPVPAATLDALPAFPVLTEREPRFFDLGRGEARTFLVSAAEPGLYRLETSGLLATEGNLRTRVVTSLHRRAENGVGRNFLVQQYLREGDYQISVKTRGRSAGHLGLRLRRTAIDDGGRLAGGVPARAFVAAGEAVAYRFRVEEKARYRLRSIGVGRTGRARLEDLDGWPLMAPEVEADLVRELEGGEYRWIVLPEPLPARQLTLLERLPEPLEYAGHGPHELPLSHRLAHRWLESPEGEERRPDVWLFTLPAAATVRVVLSGEMQGDLVRRGGGEVAYVPPERAWEGHLAAGEYELRATCVRRNNRVDYAVGVWPRELVPGESREMRAPASVAVSIGDPEAGVAADVLAELSSFGSTDVRARLYAPGGRLVAADDDRPGDWNFLLAERLAPGVYELRVDPVGTADAATRVSLALPEEHLEEVLALPVERRVEVESGVRVFPLEPGAGADVLTLSAQSAESVGVSLEVETENGWRTLGNRVGPRARLEMPVVATSSYRLRLWSLDRRGNPLLLAAAAGIAERVSEAELARGIRPRPLAGGEVGVAAVELERPGCFRLSTEDGVRFSTAAEVVADAAAGPVPAAGKTLWLAVEPVDGPRRLAAQRLELEPQAGALAVRLPVRGRATCDVRPAPGGGPVVVRARAVAGSPAVAIHDRGAGGGAMDVAREAAVAAVLTGDAPVVTAWSGVRDGAALELRLEAASFAPAAAEPAAWGELRGELAPGAWRSFALPAGEKRLRLVLQPAVVATVSVAGNGEPESVHWADRETSEVTLETRAGVLSFFHLGDGDGDGASALFQAACSPLDERGRLRPPVPGRPFERTLAGSGELRLSLPANAGATLHLRGAEAATLLGADGSIGRGRDLRVPPGGGTLLVDHLPGALLAWVDRPGSEAADLWGTAAERAPRPLAPPAVAVLGAGVEAFELAADEPRMLHLRSAAPLVTRLERPGAAPWVEIHPGGAALDAFLPPGEARLAIHALGGERPAGAVEITASGVTQIGEGLGPEVLMAAGESRVFSFRVAQPARIGVGVRADSDVVATTLLDADGGELGRGVAQMRDLEPGTYLLLLTAPAAGPPLAARPVVVGLEPPDTGPPVDVVRRYLEAARRASR